MAVEVGCCVTNVFGRAVGVGDATVVGVTGGIVFSTGVTVALTSATGKGRTGFPPTGVGV